MSKPLAHRIRPDSIESFIGQEHIVGKGKILRNLLENKYTTNMIFYGPSGTGKTTLANIVAKNTNKKLYKVNATTGSVSDIKKIVENIGDIFHEKGVLLYVDEIQNFNKRQQQVLLEFIENGDMTLIASTTENPYHYIYNAILSRSNIFEFKKLKASDIEKGIRRGIEILEDENDIKIDVEDGSFELIGNMSGGDMRRALNALEIMVFSNNMQSDNRIRIDEESIRESFQKKYISYDKKGDNHYDILSAFQKSIRGSDVDASLHYLARLIKAGDMNSICRRLIVISSEDVGLAYPTAISIVKSCVDAAMQTGFPEARIPLAQAVILLASSPKSNSVINAIDRALMDIESREIGEIPAHLRDAHYSGAKSLNRGIGYLYPHSYKNHYVSQQYLPDEIKDQEYYVAADNKMEQQFKSYLDALRKTGI